MNEDAKRAELAALRARTVQLEAELASDEAAPQPFHGYYTAYYVCSMQTNNNV